MALKELLEYQKVDAELRKMEQEIGASDERKKFMQAKKFMETAREKLDAYDKRAVELTALRDTLEKNCDEICKQIEEYSDMEEMVEGGGEIAFYKKNAQALLEKLRTVKTELNKLASDVNATVEEYKEFKKRTIEMQAQYKEYKEKFEALKNAQADKVKEIKTRLDALAKKCSGEAVEKYKAKRKEGIFPILVPLTSGGCICGMDLSLAQQGKLSGGAVIECEHCRRFIYNT